MATTAIEIKKENSINRLLFMTVQKPEGLDVDLYLADENFMPTGTASIGLSPEHNDEEAYHKDLRLKAYEKGQYVPQYSTNPEWNPEQKYIETNETL